MHKITLSNHHDVFCINPWEPEVIFSQIDTYFRHGIQIKQDDIVIDIGANIGLFTLVACEWGARSLKVYAFEPIPALLEVLQANVALYGLQNTVTPLKYGVAQERGQLEFIYYPHSTAFSTAYLSETVSDSIRDHFHKHWVLPAWQRWIGRLSPKIQDVLIDRRIRKKFAEQRVVSPTVTLSDVVRDYGLERIDLLKIDAENAELRILRGISDQDWPKIRQMVIEVHDAEMNLDAVKRILAVHSFDHVVCEQDADMEELKNVNLYASRGTD